MKPRKIFLKCGTCSQAMFHMLNHEFGVYWPEEEKASDLLAGGIALNGYQCGMLWGGALAVGAESFRSCENENLTTASAINASKRVAESFKKCAGSVDCRDISQTDWNNKYQFTLYIAKTIACGFIYSRCFNLAAKWAPQAVEAARIGLKEHIEPDLYCVSCASMTLKKMGATQEEAATVAGFAGGIGLSGGACGALGAAIWYKMLQWGRLNPGKNPPMLNNPEAKAVLNTFYGLTDNEMLCHKICGKKFGSAEEHSKYITDGGCKEIIEDQLQNFPIW